MVATDGEVAWVDTQRKAACGSCSASHGCGTSVLGQWFGQRMGRVRVLNRCDARVGDEVVIGIREDALVRGSLAVYAVPVLGLLAGAVAGDALLRRLGLASADWAGIVFGMVGLGVGLWLVHRYARRVQCDERYQPVALRHAQSPSPAWVDARRASD